MVNTPMLSICILITLQLVSATATRSIGTCESFFSFESNRPYSTQAVTQPNGLQAYRTACYRPIICWRLALWKCVLYLIHRYFVFMANESDVRPTELRTEY